MIELHLNRVQSAIDEALRMIPPAWPLASSVAVNPFLGQANERLATCASRLGLVAGTQLTMPRSWYVSLIEAGQITDVDLEAARAASPHAAKPLDLTSLKSEARALEVMPEALPTVADLAANAAQIQWPALVMDRIGAWAGSYFDEGQALWKAPRFRSAWASWKAYASHDLTPEINGISGFARQAIEAPESSLDMVARAASRLGLGDKELSSYFHQLLMSLSGWGQFARFKLWQAELAGETDMALADMLAIRIFWEEALFRAFEQQISATWASVKVRHGAHVEAQPALIVNEILQEACERAEQRRLAAVLSTEPAPQTARRPRLHAAFCIDVRSEVFRRALEHVDPAIKTIGFAGFFGVFVKHKRYASDVGELRLPVLLNPTVHSKTVDNGSAAAETTARVQSRALRAWGRFKQAAVSSFAFVEASGPIYAAKLLVDALAIKDASLPDEPKPRFEPPLSHEEEVKAAETILRAMSLTEGFAPLVLLLGHGANVVNNPHASGLHCGACGGYSGEVNARLLASLLNDAHVRVALAKRGIDIPKDTLFVAGLHDTTTDAVKLYDRDTTSASHKQDLTLARAWLAAAGSLARGERALRLPGAKSARSIPVRSRNWAEVRPEWALARCKAFIAAPRSRTSGRNLEGRAFLHDYDWKKDRDRGFGVLELIMTAPVVVASWISLQYYGSTVAPQLFGSGNKLLHNVVGGIGVIEGNGGAMRAGLALQSVHNGEAFVHEPLRLSVCIEAPVEAMTAILERHPAVRQLFDNTWLHLFAIDEFGHLSSRYRGGLEWEPVNANPAAEQMAA